MVFRKQYSCTLMLGMLPEQQLVILSAKRTGPRMLHGCSPITVWLRFVLELYSALIKGLRIFTMIPNCLKTKMRRLPDLKSSQLRTWKLVYLGLINFIFKYTLLSYIQIFSLLELPNLPTFSWFLAISMLLMTIGAANRFKLQSQKQKQKLFKLALGF